MTRPSTVDEDGVPVGARIVPARITTALDARELYGPDVDTACGTWEGNPAGDVDDWELGTHEPTREQVRLFAALTRTPVRYFYVPLEEGEQAGVVFVCHRGPTGRGRRRCEVTPAVPTPPAAEHPRKARQSALW